MERDPIQEKELEAEAAFESRLTGERDNGSTFGDDPIEPEDCLHDYDEE